MADHLGTLNCSIISSSVNVRIQSLWSYLTEVEAHMLASKKISIPLQYLFVQITPMALFLLLIDQSLY